MNKGEKIVLIGNTIILTTTITLLLLHLSIKNTLSNIVFNLVSSVFSLSPETMNLLIVFVLVVFVSAIIILYGLFKA